MFSDQLIEENAQTIQKPTDLLCEYTENPLGIDVAQPRFSWRLHHSERGRVQYAYQILVASSREKLDENIGDMWDSGKVVSRETVNIEYDGKPLESRRTYYWKVRWWDDKNKVSPFSNVATFEMGLLNPEDWEARWIGGNDLLRRSFMIEGQVKQARAYISGLGWYELRINGKKVGDRQLDPGLTEYDKILLYSTYDITSYLRKGENVVGVMLGRGRYCKHYNAPPKVILQINISLANGDEKIIVTDESWKVSKGPVVENDIYDGEVYDARLEKEGWDQPGYDDSQLENVTVMDPPGGTLVSQATFPPIRAVRTLTALNISNPKPCVYVFDFGQNFTGWVRLTVSGPRGTEVKLRYAELLNPDGTINTAPNRGAKATDVYILKGEGTEVYEPRFTYHGFRYVEVTGLPYTPIIDTLKGIVVHTDVKQKGSFLCSNQLINSIHRLVFWSQLSNLMSIPTDCPQRDERLGWMGDAQLSAEEALYNFDMAAFYMKWLRDIRAAQKEDGSVPDVVPVHWLFSELFDPYPADPAWGTACITIPWLVYLHYGDKRILEENYETIRKWVDFLAAKSENYIVKYSKFGDWVPPGFQKKTLETPGELISTWYYYYDCLLLTKIAHVLGRSDDEEKYACLSEKIKTAFNKEFLKGDHYTFDWRTLITGSQTSNLLPLYLDMVPEEKRETVLNKLLQDIIVDRDSHLGTGIVGTRYLLDTLTKYGYTELAYKIVTQTTYPGWGYMVENGATTLWERWEYMVESDMNSHNHIMLGSVDAWFYKVLAGINVDPSAPGFEKVIVKPHVAGDLSHVSASVNTIRGLVSSRWARKGGSLTLEVTIPVNSEGKIYVPTIGLKNPIVKESGRVIWKNNRLQNAPPEITSGKKEGKYIVFTVGSGSYTFQVAESL